MFKRIFIYIHALAQFYTDLFLFWIENHTWNTIRVLFSFVSKQNTIRVDYPLASDKQTKTLSLYYNAESYHRITLFHLLHSYKQMYNLVHTIPLHTCRYILDLGANCGHFSVMASEKFGEAKIFAFEPSPTLHSVLQKNIGNRNIELVAKAVSNVVGTTKFHINPAGQQTNSILVESVENLNKNYQTIEVPVITLDFFMTEKQISSIDILKIDCQGVESLILKGAVKVLQNTNYLILEISFFDKGVQELLNFVSNYFPYYKVVNPVLLGADLVFSKKPF